HFGSTIHRSSPVQDMTCFGRLALVSFACGTQSMIRNRCIEGSSWPHPQWTMITIMKLKTLPKTLLAQHRANSLPNETCETTLKKTSPLWNLAFSYTRKKDCPALNFQLVAAGLTFLRKAPMALS